MKSGQEEYEEYGSFRTLLLNYQFMKTLKITNNSRTVQAFDISTKKDVVIKFVKDTVVGYKNTKGSTFCICTKRCEGHPMYSAQTLPSVELRFSPSLPAQKETSARAYDLSLDSWVNQRNILPILNHRNIVRQVFCKKFENYSVICTDYFSGSCPGRGLKEDDILLVVEQIVSIVSYLALMRISVSEINLRDILVDRKGEIRLIRLNRPSFEDTISSSVERRYIRSILKIFCLLASEEKLDECACLMSIDIKGFVKSLNGATPRNINNARLKSIYNLLVEDCTIKSLAMACGIRQDFEFKCRLLVDPAVLSQIQSLGLPRSLKEYFDPGLVNNPNKKEYYIYRLIEENCTEFSASEPVEAIRRFIYERGALITNRLEDAECNAITPRERERHASIKHRVAALKDIMYYPSSLRNCMTCAKLGTKSSLDLQILKRESFFDIMKVLRQMKVSSWRIRDKIQIKEENMGLEIIISLRKNGWILASKEHGRDADFLHLMSELVEYSKSIK